MEECPNMVVSALLKQVPYCHPLFPPSFKQTQLSLERGEKNAVRTVAAGRVGENRKHLEGRKIKLC